MAIAQLTKTSRVIGVVLSSIIGVAAAAFLTKADGNITMYLVGGIVLLIAIYILVMSIIATTKTPSS